MKRSVRRKLAQAAQTKALEEKALADQARLQAERKKNRRKSSYSAEKYLYLGQIKEALNHFQNHDLVATRLALNETRRIFAGRSTAILPNFWDRSPVPCTDMRTV